MGIAKYLYRDLLSIRYIVCLISIISEFQCYLGLVIGSFLLDLDLVLGIAKYLYRDLLSIRYMFILISIIILVFG